MEDSITQGEKDEELRLFTLLDDRYARDGYVAFRNRLGFHIDLEEAMKEPKIGGNLHDITMLILAWYKHAATIIYEGEPLFFTSGASLMGKQMAKQFKDMMLSAVRYRRGRARAQARRRHRSH